MAKIYIPINLNGLISLLKRYPNAVIFSGGIENIIQNDKRLFTIPDILIYIGKIEEMQRIKRGERYLEIGAGSKISHIIDKGSRYIPVILLEALKKITPPNFKNFMTIGGMLCSKLERNNIYAALSILDTKLELRSSTGLRWIKTGNLFINGKIDLKQGEIVTKIRIALSDYYINIHRKINNDFGSSGKVISFSAISDILKGNISFVKFAFSSSDQFIIRNKELEADLTGQNLPLAEKTKNTLVSNFTAMLLQQYPDLKEEYRKNIIINTFRWFLEELEYY